MNCVANNANSDGIYYSFVKILNFCVTPLHI